MALLVSTKLANSGHRAIVIHDFTNDAGRCQTRQTGKVQGGFGVTGATQYPTRAGLQRKYMTGFDKGLGSHCWVGQ